MLELAAMVELVPGAACSSNYPVHSLRRGSFQFSIPGPVSSLQSPPELFIAAV